jgi:methionyl-tRNA formyltransferase
MKEIGAQLLVKTVKGLADGSLIEKPQDTENQVTGHALKHAPKIFTETCKIDWNQPVSAIYNLIRGLAPYPAAFTYLNDKMLKIYKAKKEMHNPGSKWKKEPGTFETDNKTYLKFAGIDGYIHIIELQLEGKKRMTIEEFLRGYKPPAPKGE